MPEFNLLNHRELEVSPEQIGRNVEIRLIFMRHGEKDPINRENGLLTERGKEQFQEFAEEELGDPNRTLVCYGTEIPRTAQSCLEALKTSGAQVKVYPEPLDELDMRIGEQNQKDRKTRFSRAFLETMKGMPVGHNVRQYLGYGRQRPDPDTYSPQEFAGGVAKVILNYETKVGRITSGKKTDVLLVSHDFVLSSFIQEVLGEKFTAEHPTLEPAGYFEVLIKTDGQGQHSMEGVYQGRHFNFDPEVLKSFAQKYD